MEGDEDELDHGPACFGEPAPMPVIAIHPFSAMVESRRDETMLPARVVGIRQAAAQSDEFDFVAVTEEDGRFYCEAYRSVLKPD
jgi:hypothetical protein